MLFVESHSKLEASLIHEYCLIIKYENSKIFTFSNVCPKCMMGFLSSVNIIHVIKNVNLNVPRVQALIFFEYKMNDKFIPTRQN